jgi:hypothetical protein
LQIVLEAVRRAGSALEDASERLRGDVEVHTIEKKIELKLLARIVLSDVRQPASSI